jgi:hypothetical protein
MLALLHAILAMYVHVTDISPMIKFTFMHSIMVHRKPTIECAAANYS